MKRSNCFLPFILLTLFGCTHNAVLDESAQLPPEGWVYSDAQSITLNVEDTLSLYNYYLTLRNTSTYPYRNFLLFFRTYKPNQTFTVDTVDCPLADASGRWLGSGIGDIIDNDILFKVNQRFHQTGTHRFEIQHAMRTDTVSEIMNVGLRIERVVRE